MVERSEDGKSDWKKHMDPHVVPMNPEVNNVVRRIFFDSAFRDERGAV